MMLSKCLLNTDRHGTSTTFLGSLFQCLTSLPNIQSEPPLPQALTLKKMMYFSNMSKRLCPAVLERVIAAALQQMAGFCHE